VAYLRFSKLRLEDKSVPHDFAGRLKSVPVKTPVDFCLKELESNEESDLNPLDEPQSSIHQLEHGSIRVASSNSGGIFVSGLVCQSVDELGKLMESLKSI
jgi:hypothetical protein